MSEQVVVPSQTMIEAWKGINELPIVETAPRSVPLTIIISPPTEDFCDRVLPIQSCIPASKHMISIKEINKRIDLVDQYLRDYYSRRSFAEPLQKYIDAEKKASNQKETPSKYRSAEAKVIVQNMVDPLIDLLKKEKSDCEEIASYIGMIFCDMQFWNEAQYTDLFFSRLCMLIHKFTALEFIVLTKRSLVDDLSFFLTLLNNSTYAAEMLPIRAWIFQKNAITDMVIKKCSEVSPIDSMNIFSICFDHIKKALISHSYIVPDQHYAYVTAAVFFCQYYDYNISKEQAALKGTKKPKPKMKPPPVDVCYFMKSLLDFHKSLTLIFEISPSSLQALPDSFVIKNNEPAPIEITLYTEENLDQMLHNIREDYRHLSAFISINIESDDVNNTSGLKLNTNLPRVLRSVGRIIGLISDHLEMRRLKAPDTLPNPPPENPRLYQYLNSMCNMSDSMKNTFLLHLMHCRLITEMLINNLPDVFQLIQSYIQSYIQNFVQIVLPPIILHHKEHPEIKTPLEAIRTTLGYFKNADFEINDKTVKALRNKQPIVPKCGPMISLIELARVQIQLLTNSESPAMKKSGIFASNFISKEEAAPLIKFVEDSVHFVDLMQLPQTMNSVSDQSRLYFKERWLDFCKTSFFKVTSSLPVILSSYALQHNSREDLTSAIFYPLLIYDDAASTALNYLHSKMLYEEIRAESRMCLMSITRMVADSLFHPIRKFAALRSLPKTITDQVIAQVGTLNRSIFTESFSISHLGVILQQNQLFLLGCPIDTKNLIAERVADIMRESIREVVGLAQKHGLLVIIAIRRIISILQSTHRIMMSYGLPLIPFNDILSNAIASDTPNSFSSLLLINVSNHTTGSLLSDFYLMTNPNRLIPKSQPSINFSVFFKENPGVLMEVILRPTASFVSVESFRELFWMIDDGAISVLHTQLLIELQEQFSLFAEVYARLAKQLRRIKDAPINSNSSQVLDRFLGAYRFFLDNPDLHQIFSLMGEIGTIFAVSEMMDNAYILKRVSREQVSSFIMSRSSTDIAKSNAPDGHPEFFELFDNPFRSTQPYFNSYNNVTSDKEVIAPLLHVTIQEFSKLIKQYNGLFEETSSNILDLQSLNGFASMWSVLDFLFCMIEVLSGDKNHYDLSKGSLVKYGEGVQITAGLILCITNQRSLFRLLNIGEKVAAHVASDFAADCSVLVKRYLAVYKLMSSSLSCSIATFKPAVDQAIKDK